MSKSKEKLNLFLDQKKINVIVAKLAEQITRDYEAILTNGSELMIVVTLKGSMFFAADLMRHLSIPLKIDFIRVASYGSGTESSRNVIMTKDLESDPHAHHILVLDEIIDTGHTITFLLEKFQQHNPKSLKVCTLLNKPSRRETEVPVDYIGMDVEDKFLVGYGLDYNENYRNLKDIYYIEGTEE